MTASVRVTTRDIPTDNSRVWEDAAIAETPSYGIRMDFVQTITVSQSSQISRSLWLRHSKNSYFSYLISTFCSH